MGCSELQPTLIEIRFNRGQFPFYDQSYLNIKTPNQWTSKIQLIIFADQNDLKKRKTCSNPFICKCNGTGKCTCYGYIGLKGYVSQTCYNHLTRNICDACNWKPSDSPSVQFYYQFELEKTLNRIPNKLRQEVEQIKILCKKDSYELFTKSDQNIRNFARWFNSCRKLKHVLIDAEFGMGKKEFYTPEFFDKWRSLIAKNIKLGNES